MSAEHSATALPPTTMPHSPNVFRRCKIQASLLAPNSTRCTRSTDRTCPSSALRCTASLPLSMTLLHLMQAPTRPGVANTQVYPLPSPARVNGACWLYCGALPPGSVVHADLIWGAPRPGDSQTWTSSVLHPLGWTVHVGPFEVITWPGEGSTSIYLAVSPVRVVGPRRPPSGVPPPG